MRVEVSIQAGQVGGMVDESFVELAEDRNESRALVVTAPAAVIESRPVHRQATFLAHLIATKEQAPQTRTRRRAEPSEAISAYRTVAALTRAQ